MTVPQFTKAPEDDALQLGKPKRLVWTETLDAVAARGESPVIRSTADVIAMFFISYTLRHYSLSLHRLIV